MVAKKGGSSGRATAAEDSVEELTRVPLQAILLADSFATKFRPITLERPKVLLPLVNVPMIDYTLAWLESAGVEEVFVFCCAHSKQVIQHLEASKWFSQPGFLVTSIESNNAIGVGDALRLVYERNVIRGDFVLVSGDTVSNMPLSDALRDHKERRKKDNNAIMTLVVKRSKQSPVTGQSRLGTDELFMAIDPDTKQLLYYEDKSDKISLDKALLSDHPYINLHNDKQDCYIDICSPDVLSIFADNFDYQHLRRHFVKGLLDDDIMSYKIFTHEIHSSYAAPVDNFRSYDTVSKDIIQRWTYPLVPDIQYFGNCSTKLDRNGVYRGSDIGQSRSADIGPFTVLGSGTTVGNHTKISNSVVGEGCKIGSNVSIDGCYIWHNVTIEDGCKLRHAIVCDGVVIKSDAALNSGVVLSYKVIVGEKFVVPAYSKVSLFRQPIKEDSDDELENADNSSGSIEASYELNAESTMQLSESQLKAESMVGIGGIGYIWPPNEADHEEDWRRSVAPIPPEKVSIILSHSEDVPENLSLKHIPSGTTDPVDSENEDIDDYHFFEKEVEETFLRGVHENVKEDNIVLEVNSLRLSYNLTFSECASALFYAMMKWALHMPRGSHSDLLKNTEIVILKWQKLLKYYLPSIDEEMEVILKFEEMCLESTKDFSLVFVQILHLLYDRDIIEEEAILNWAREKEGADESDKVFLKQSEKFIQWLNEASEEEEEED